MGRVRTGTGKARGAVKMEAQHVALVQAMFDTIHREIKHTAQHPHMLLHAAHRRLRIVDHRTGRQAAFNQLASTVKSSTPLSIHICCSMPRTGGCG